MRAPFASLGLLLAVSVSAHGEITPPADSLPLESETRHSLAAQLGYGPGRNLPGQTREEFGFLRYQMSYFGYNPTREWPRWTFYSRLWLDYSNQMEFQTEPELTRTDGASIEWRDFYVQRHELMGDPRFSARVGRQSYRDLNGIWWNTSLESAQLLWTDTFSQGFVALGQPLHSFNSGEGQLSDEEKNNAYVLGEYSWRWAADHWAGMRMLAEIGHGGGSADRTRTYRIGSFAHGEPALAMLSDYRLEGVIVRGNRDLAQPDGSTARQQTRGWAIVGEAGKQFPDRKGHPRIAMRGGVTDQAQEQGDGFYLNTLQSARAEQTGGYSSGLAGAMPNLTLANTLLYGVLLELKPHRTVGADLLVATLYCRSDNGALPLRVDSSSSRCEDSHAGYVVDSNLTFRPFPIVRWGHRLNWFHRLNLTYFRNGDANPAGDNDIRISLHSELTF